MVHSTFCVGWCSIRLQYMNLGITGVHRVYSVYHVVHCSIWLEVRIYMLSVT